MSDMDLKRRIEEQGRAAKAASRGLGVARADLRNGALLKMADALERGAGEILAANGEDVAAARANGTSEAMIDRLALNGDRIKGMAGGLRQAAALPDPVGEVIGGATRPNGLEIRKVRVPLGVVGMIYESRPNVTADAIGLCLKSGNAVMLRGGSEAIRSNRVIVKILSDAAYGAGIERGAIQFIDSTEHESVGVMMSLTGLLSVIIPRGGAGLIRRVVRESAVPVIETGAGICHTFVDFSADLDMAASIALNAKTSRPAVCNAMETLLVHGGIADKFLPMIAARMREKNVEMRGDEAARKIVPDMKEATDEDWATEYDDLILSVKVVNGIDEAIEHINRYNTGHSETIVTRDLLNAHRFQQEVDAACVYVNASTRFTDGGEFGLGAEIGISTQRLHARGPMGLVELTTTKYLVYGDGQIRE